LYSISKKQLEALKNNNLRRMEELTSEREAITGMICRMIEEGSVDFESNIINRKAHDFTRMILDIDEAIKNALIDELLRKTLELSRIQLITE
jgi:hypothetical protein